MTALPTAADIPKATIDKDTFHAKFLDLLAALAGLLGTDGTAATARAQLGIVTGTGEGEIPLIGTMSATEILAGLVVLATQADAEAGTASDVVMTPVRVAQAIAALSPPTVKVSPNDTTPGYLNGKLVAGTNVTLTEGSDGGDETLTIAVSGGVSADVGAGGVSSIAVGAFALMYVNIGSVLSGNTIAGSSLLYAAITSSSGAFATGGTPPGTWRNLTASSLQGGFIDIGIFQRIA